VLRLIFLAFILVIAGIIHLMDPFSFVNSIPPFIPYKLEIIFITGVLEIITALGLMIKRLRPFFAKLAAVYFILLIPIHIYVSFYSISMFGVSDPLLLWGRTFFQLVFICWAFSLRKV
jgi:uncharacterized membrane protein